MRCQELDQPANAGLAAEALAHLARLLFRNPRNLRQPFGLIFQHVEAGRAKTRNNLLRRLCADARCLGNSFCIPADNGDPQIIRPHNRKDTKSSFGTYSIDPDQLLEHFPVLSVKKTIQSHSIFPHLEIRINGHFFP